MAIIECVVAQFIDLQIQFYIFKIIIINNIFSLKSYKFILKFIIFYIFIFTYFIVFKIP